MPATLTAEVYRALNGRTQKYGAKRTEVDGYSFASKKEAARYVDLKNMQAAGAITGLVVHPSWPLDVNGEVVGKYTADFAYSDPQSGAVTVEDVKSRATRTEAYRLRKGLMWACYRIRIVEV
jgi:hypothetical protein